MWCSAIVPYGTTGTVASIQVINNTGASDIRTVRVKDGTPGIYTNPRGRRRLRDRATCPGQLLRHDHASESGPSRAKPFLLYLTGLGDVNPPVPDGVPAPIDSAESAGDDPGRGGRWRAGDGRFRGSRPHYRRRLRHDRDHTPRYRPRATSYLDISLPDSYTTEAQISIGASSLANQSPGKSPQSRDSRGTKPAVQIPGTLRRFPNR